MLPGGPGFRFAAEVCSVERAERVLVSLIRDPEKDVSFCLIRLQGSLKVFASEAAAEAWFANTLRIDSAMHGGSRFPSTPLPPLEPKSHYLACFSKQWRNIMIFKWLAIAFLAAMITGPASAQTTSAVTHKEGEWRGSKLAGVNVYNEANEKIGDINDVIVDRSGKVSNVILGVGGVLGLGEHYVAVPFEKLKWVDQLVASTTASTTSAPANAPATPSASDGTTQTTTGAVTTTTTTTTTIASSRWYPDHAVYNATKDELKALPEFKY